VDELFLALGIQGNARFYAGRGAAAIKGEPDPGK
jgi:hypothetical protein